MSGQGSVCDTESSATCRNILSASTDVTSPLQSTSPQTDATSSPMSGQGTFWETESSATWRSSLRASTEVTSPLQSTSPWVRPVGVSVGVGVGVGVAGPTTWRHSENSDVSLVTRSVAVAVTNCPAGTLAVLNVNAASPFPSVVTWSELKYTWPSPNPD